MSPSFHDQFQDAYAKAQKDLGRFNLAVFGNTGCGKSTLINAMFGDEVAKTGIGKPVTRGTHYYEHPSGFFGFYDSEGTETGQAGNEVLEKFRTIVEDSRKRPSDEHIHAIWYCVRATDGRFEDAQAEFVRELAKLNVQVIFVLTQAPMRNEKLTSKVTQLTESIEARGLPIADGRVHPVMALADDEATCRPTASTRCSMPPFRSSRSRPATTLNAAQQIDMARKRRHARKAVVAAASLAGVTGATPIPFADAAALVPVQAAMMAKVAAGFGLGLQKGSIASLAGAAILSGGATFVGKTVVTSLLKFVPGANVAAMTIRAGVASSLTMAIGTAWIEVCVQLVKLGPDAAEKIPADELRVDVFLREFKKAARREGGEARRPEQSARSSV